MTTTASRRHKWHYPQPSTPRILHLPSRPRRKQCRSSVARPSSGDPKGGRLEVLFDQERVFSRNDYVSVPVVLLENGHDEQRRRDRVAECEESGSGAAEEVVVEEEEKWRFQAEVLRAECNLLRMEKEIALRKLDRNRTGLDRTLRSAILALVSGRKKISEGKNATTLIEEEIQNLVDNLKELRKGSREGGKEGEVKSCSNFDAHASVLRRRLEKLGTISEQKRMEKVREMAEESLSMNTNFREDIDGDDFAPNASPTREISKNEGTCSGQCKTVVKRIVEQVRAETEQWSQMQEMLEQVRDEMDELQSSRDFWEDRALESDTRNHSLRSAAQEWRDKALSAESKVTELQVEVSMLRDEIDTMRNEPSTEATREKTMLPHNETEKRVLVSSLKENRRHRHHHNHENTDRTSQNSKQKEVEVSSSSADNRRRKVHSSNTSRVEDSKRSPLGDIGNSSRQSGRVVLPSSCQQLPFGRLLRENRY